MNFKFTSTAVLLSSFASALAPVAQAVPHHIMMPSAYNKAAGNCVFPDGSSPKGHPELHCIDPANFFAAYGIDKLHAQGITGKGQVIILVDSFGSPTAQADLDHFSDTFKLPRTQIEFIYPNGPFVNDMSDDDKSGWAGETTLDLEWAHAIAPDAKIVNVLSNTSETVGLAGLPDLFAGIEMAIQKYPGAVVSMSFGTGEPTFTADDIKNYLQGSFHQTLQNATNAGMTLLASSGDSGSTNLDAAQKALISYANASYPASDPLITAVGGTSLQYNWKWNPSGTADDYWACQMGNPSSCAVGNFLTSTPTSSRLETVWKEDWSFAAGGAGVSTIFDAPDYQTNLDASIQSQVKGKRGLPDVSMNAAINGGVMIYTSYSAMATTNKAPAGKPTWESTGGTSCAAPETAALVALAGQKASDTLGRQVSIGYLNPILYSLSGDDFNDIVSQKMGVKQQVSIDNEALYFNAQLASALPKNVPAVAVPGYYTAPGFDLATGLGTPKAEKFVLDVASARVAKEASAKAMP